MLPQLIVIGLMFIGLGIELSKHGQVKEGKHNVITTLIAVIINIFILYWGGFWDVFFN